MPYTTPSEVLARAHIIKSGSKPQPIPLDPLDAEICKTLKPYLINPRKLNLSQATSLRAKLLVCWLGYQTEDWVRFMDTDIFYRGGLGFTRKAALFNSHIGSIIGDMSAKERKTRASLDKTLMARSKSLVTSEHCSFLVT